MEPPKASSRSPSKQIQTIADVPRLLALSVDPDTNAQRGKEHGTANVVYHRSQQRVRPLHVEQLLQRGDRVDGTARKLEQLDHLKAQ